MKNLSKALVKSLLIPSVLTEASAAIQKKFFGSRITTMIISNKQMNDIMKMAESLKGAVLFAKVFNQRN